MPIIKQNFELDYSDCKKLEEITLKIKDGVENTINNCLKDIVSPKITKSVTNFIPKSEKGKRHAKENKWYELKYYNLAFVLSNSLRGKRKTSFYYLYYPATGTGNSYKKGPNDFLGKGVAKGKNNAVTDLLNALNKKIEEEMKL